MSFSCDRLVVCGFNAYPSRPSDHRTFWYDVLKYWKAWPTDLVAYWPWSNSWIAFATKKSCKMCLITDHCLLQLLTDHLFSGPSLIRETKLTFSLKLTEFLTLFSEKQGKNSLKCNYCYLLEYFCKFTLSKITRDADASRKIRGKMSLQSHQSQVKCVEKTEILKLCDKYFEEDVPEYYFDRWEK